MQCDSVSYQAASMLRLDGSLKSSTDALGLLCSLPRASLEHPCLDECNALGAVISQATAKRLSARVSGWTALFALAVRNGIDVATSSDLCGSVCQGWIALLQEV